MYDDITALMGGASDPKEKQMADALRNKQKTGNFFAMSTLQPISAMGRNMSDEANTAAKTFGGLARSRKELEARKASDSARLAETMNSNSETARHNKAAEDTARLRADAEAQYRKDVIKQQELDRLAKAKKAAVENDPEIQGHSGVDPSAGEKKTYSSNLSIQNQLGKLSQKALSLTPEQIKQADQTLKQWAADKLFTSGKQFVNEKLINTDPDVREFFAMGNALQAVLSKNQAGLSVTGFELQDRKEWSPLAPGITMAERMTRMQNLYEAINQDNNIFEYQYGNRFKAPLNYDNKLDDAAQHISRGEAENAEGSDTDIEKTAQSLLERLKNLDEITDENEINKLLSEYDSLTGVKK